MKVRSLDWSLPNVLMQEIIVSSMGIKSQFFWTTFLLKFNAMNLYQPWRFPLVPRKTPSLVLEACILCGLSSSCIWQYCTSCRRMWFLKSKISPDMIVLGLRVPEIPPLLGNKYIIFIILWTKWLVRSFVMGWKGRLWQVSLHHSFTTLIRLLMSGSCSFYVDRFTRGYPVRYSISLFKGPTSLYTYTVVMHKPRCR